MRSVRLSVCGWYAIEVFIFVLHIFIRFVKKEDMNTGGILDPKQLIEETHGGEICDLKIDVLIGEHPLFCKLG